MATVDGRRVLLEADLADLVELLVGRSLGRRAADSLLAPHWAADGFAAWVTRGEVLACLNRFTSHGLVTRRTLARRVSRLRATLGRAGVSPSVVQSNRRFGLRLACAQPTALLAFPDVRGPQRSDSDSWARRQGKAPHLDFASEG